MPLVTFDFHNTLAHCDTWFDLEVFHITSAVSQRLELQDDPELLDAEYRALRSGVIDSGIEISAADGVASVLKSRGHAFEFHHVSAIVDELILQSAHDLRATEGSVDAVRWLRDRNYALGVISSAAHHEFVETSLHTLGIRECFDFVLTSVRTGMYKSNPDIYSLALRTANSEAHTSLHVGDSMKWDVESAQIAGMKTGWIRSPQRYETPAVPDLTFDSLAGAGPVIDDFVRNLK